MKTYLIIDFDSTFITGESLDWLAEVTLEDKSSDKRKRIIEKIEKITRAGMEGEMSFTDSLRQRLALFQPTKSHVARLIKRIQHSVTPSFQRNRLFIQQNAQYIRIVSGGFHEYMDPILKSFGISKEHICGNFFEFDGDTVVGFDSENVLCRQNGKGEVVRSMNLDGRVVVIGDGFTDYEIVKEGIGDEYIAFTENVKRDFVTDLQLHTESSFDGVISYLNPLHKKRVV